MTDPVVAAIVLAAGTSTRMRGANNLLLDVGGQPMIRRVVETVRRGVPSVTVVAGHEAEGVAATLAGLERP
jgi:molybdenum cofactor cytidylyltransferase